MGGFGGVETLGLYIHGGLSLVTFDPSFDDVSAEALVVHEIRVESWSAAMHRPTVSAMVWAIEAGFVRSHLAEDGAVVVGGGSLFGSANGTEDAFEPRGSWVAAHAIHVGAISFNNFIHNGFWHGDMNPAAWQILLFVPSGSTEELDFGYGRFAAGWVEVGDIQSDCLTLELIWGAEIVVCGIFGSYGSNG